VVRGVALEAVEVEQEWNAGEGKEGGRCRTRAAAVGADGRRGARQRRMGGFPIGGSAVERAAGECEFSRFIA
jgi:hypothetical protein